jgi:hypothetical protein
MSGLKIPLDFSSGSFYEKNWKLPERNEEHSDKSIKESIDDFIELLITSSNGAFKPDTRFGFSLKNCQFENANSKDEIKGKKIGGKSDNANNYAKDLEKTITLFEPRLQNLEIKTDFDKKQSKIAISITGMITDTNIEYKRDIEFHIWKNDEKI